jgi:glycosyltransferase involved in cell wall biosynthesis/SAM-dependent methyltransferase
MKSSKVCVVDMQPITPAVGGGRQRLLGLYHNLGDNLDAVYVGTYDWPGENFRDQQLTPGLREICVPLSDAHYAAGKASSERMQGRGVIDIEFPNQVELSPRFRAVARREARAADIVIFSHPWCYPSLRDVLRREQLIVYDSHNVESVLRTTLHDDLPQAGSILSRTAQVEYELCQRSDLILACSHEDRETFAKLYDADWHRLRVIPNGIFVFSQDNPPPGERLAERLRLAAGPGPLAIFLGSDYPPNNEAALLIVEQLAPTLPEVQFAIIGSCCNALTLSASQPNVRRLGVLEEDLKKRWLRAADVALNPIESGSGTNIKMFDYMAAGLPTVTTEIGARGIVCTGEIPYVPVKVGEFASAIERLLQDADERVKIGARARRAVENFYSWERLSPNLGRLLTKRMAEKGSPRRSFSIVVPTYERPHLLDVVMQKMAAQQAQDFEVIIVDQSEDPWPNADAHWKFPVTYVRSEVRGAVQARNIGGHLASGRIIAFTDDDCEPAENWLLNAQPYFDDASVVGLEGLIRSDRLGDPDWRPVTNVGLEGIGFMTANLFVRNETFQSLDGFDLAFDEPHFREDTDFGWRMVELGATPYAAEVEVYHPAHRRDTARESQEERNRFFEKDALLLKRHPERYRELFHAEGHYLLTAGFWPNFVRGLEKYNIEEPEWIEALRLQTHVARQENVAAQRFTTGTGRHANATTLVAQHILMSSKLGVEALSLEYPAIVARNLSKARSLVEEVRKIVHASGVKTDYVECSLERYKHYVAAVLSLPREARLLEVGAAPGHVSIAVKLAGYSSIGLNLNELWRATYPGSDWLNKLDVREQDIENQPLPFDEGAFDAVLFTEVLEHVAVVNPLIIVREIFRVLKPGGMLIFSTPNVCNISNVYALLNGVNIFWPPEIFYGGLDRHNREYTPNEVRTLLTRGGFSKIQLYGINDHNNWRSGASDFAYAVVSSLGDQHPLLRNTTVGIAVKQE